MPKENDLEGPQDQGGKHGGQAGMPSHSPTAADQGLCATSAGRNSRGIKSERSKCRKDKGNDPRAEDSPRGPHACFRAPLHAGRPFQALYQPSGNGMNGQASSLSLAAICGRRSGLFESCGSPNGSIRPRGSFG
jgi:hypothetical protein